MMDCTSVTRSDMVCSSDPRESEFFCYTDGASRGNPGPASYAFLVIKKDTILHEESGFLGVSTNNVAEYMAVIHGLQWLTHATNGPVHVYSDSELVMRQLSGTYAVKKPHLAKLYRDVSVLSKRFEKVTYQSVPRENHYIRWADTLCNQELDRKREPQE
jgi:ribonuclease HI